MLKSPLVSDDLVDAVPGWFVHHWVVRLQDVDAAGVVFFPRILELFNDALFAYADAAGCSLVSLMKDEGVILPVRRTHAEYLKPLRFGEALRIAPVRGWLDGSDLAFGFRLTHPGPDGQSDEVAAVGVTEHVCVDARSFERTAPPERLVSALRRVGAPA